jgi:3-dehydroquinate dehydratase-2
MPVPSVRVLVLNGPNLNLLGTREADIYGLTSLDEIAAGLRAAFPDVAFDFRQDNGEGALVDALHAAERDGCDGVVFNPGAYGHTSIALRDAIAAVRTPVVEVHLSNVYTREGFRRRLVLAPVCAGVITGLGPAGYHLAVRYLRDFARGAASSDA